MRTLIVFSHLRWDFVFQRPQHLLSRLAREYRVLFIEEPVQGMRSPYLERLAPCENVEVLRPRVTGALPGFDDSHFEEVGDLLTQYLDDFSISDYAVWFYTPMAWPLLAWLHPNAVIYDCMDELSAFLNAPPQLIERERKLLARADVVFTGGPSLYEAKRRMSGNVHCVPSAVDGKHFAQMSCTVSEKVAALIDHVPGPQLGFFGVIDERLDIALLTALADARPEWQFMLVGPVVKIHLTDLPMRPNLHWLGQQSYETLPQFMQKWDVCLLPFALNDSTRFISPTKTLEYMAAGKPIVSSPIRDVVLLYGDSVHIAQGVQAFVDACEACLHEAQAATQRRRLLMHDHVNRATWDGAARLIQREVEHAVASQSRNGEPRAATGRNVRPAGVAPSSVQPLHAGAMVAGQ